MITIKIDRILLFLLILGCLIDGSVFELVFFVALGLLLFRNRKEILRNKYYKLFILIIGLYLILLFLTLTHFHNLNTWRPVGITKVLCGLSLCVLLNDNLIKYDVERQLLLFLIFFNFYYFIFGTTSGLQQINTGFMNLPIANTLSCLNMIMLPHLFHTLKGKLKIIKAIYVVSFIWILFKYAGSTLYVSILIYVLWTILHFIIINVKIRKIIVSNFSNRILPVLAGAFILLFLFNENIQSLYLDLLGHADKDRFTILFQAITRLRTISKTELFWGRGDNNFYLLTGRYIVPHNFILEVVTFEGLAGLAVLVFETVVFLRFIFMRKKGSQNKNAILLSLIFGYLFFMLHPVYTSSFLVKIFLVLINLRAAYLIPDEDQKIEGALLYDKKDIKFETYKVNERIYNLDLH